MKNECSVSTHKPEEIKVTAFGDVTSCRAPNFSEETAAFMAGGFLTVTCTTASDLANGMRALVRRGIFRTVFEYILKEVCRQDVHWMQLS